MKGKYRLCVVLGLLILFTIPAFGGVVNQSSNGGSSSQTTPTGTSSGDLSTSETSVSTFVTVLPDTMEIGSAESVDDSGNDRTTGIGSLSIQCDFPAQILEAGETAEFLLNIYNTGAASGPLKLRAAAPIKPDQWTFKFMDGETQVAMVDAQQNSAKSVKLSMETPSDLKPDDYPVRVMVGDAQYTLYITISKTHAGENGTLQLTVNDLEGKVKGAAISLFGEGNRDPIERVFTDADGVVDAEVTPGIYTLQIEKSGYARVERKEIRIKSGITTELNPVTIKPLDYVAEVLVSSPQVIVPTGKNPLYEMTLKNIGKSDDTYQFASSDLPEDWTVRFRDAADNRSELSHVTLKAGDQRDLIVEVIPGAGTPAGTYNLSIKTGSSRNWYQTNLTAELQGGDQMMVMVEKDRFDLTRGDTLSFNTSVQNAGDAGALTNVNLSLSTPKGWNTIVTPPSIGSILNGGQGDFTVKLVPPANTSPSEYQVGVFVASDQVQKSDTLRVMVHEQSPAVLLGVIMLVLVGGGLWYVSRRGKLR
ncbi:COG1470 family protein [Methanosphaerula subterraneus]|uniref:COG1470 family protein n=1 Tax=Methanosphaerula subterraneus TaxID=3350244 RepID=UPI003F85433F